MSIHDKGPSSLARLLTRAPLVLSRHLWVWPLLGALLISAVGFWVRNRVESSTRADLASHLQTVLNADVAALKLWFTEQELDARTFASDSRVQEAILELADLAANPATDQAALAGATPAATLNEVLKPLIEAQQYLDYVVVGKDKRVLASPHRRQINRPAPPGYNFFVQRALDGKVAISRPFARELLPSQRNEGPTMFVAAPVKATNGAVVAVLGLRMKPEDEFSRIFSVATMGESSEAYAFDRRGVMLTASRFDAELKTLGIIPNTPEATAILNLRLLDPGRDLREPGQPLLPRDKLELTRMAAAATRGLDGCDVTGYRNYRGVKVIGAWAWLPEYAMGVATEVSVDEAFQMLYVLRRAFLVLFLLLALCGISIFCFTLLVDRLQSSIRKSAVGAGVVGPYVLVQEIGRGANGHVYRARHTLLRRPVAIKLLSPEMTNDATAARFEQEVQMTSQLTHPNTVAIYDYGHTPEGLFYYAMEYLSGIDLDQLVRRHGPQPEGRVIHILSQICGSLGEAHRIGLIHRDVKPANIVLTRRGGAWDVVKVLDFGLVKAVNTGRAAGLSTNAVVGTPHFMAPEAVVNPTAVDGRGDLYSVAAVGYWLLTGRTLFDTEDVSALLDQRVKEAPPTPSERLGKSISADLEGLIMKCLSKSPEERLLSADALGAALSECVSAGTWTSSEAEQWWRANAMGLEVPAATTMAEKTLVIAART